MAEPTGFAESGGCRLPARLFHEKYPTDKGEVPYGECQSSPNKNTAELGGNPSESETFCKAEPTGKINKNMKIKKTMR